LPTAAVAKSARLRQHCEDDYAQSFYKAVAIEPVRFYYKPSDAWYAIAERGGSYYRRRRRIRYAGNRTGLERQARAANRGRRMLCAI
jgi:hypothetical protein